MLKSSYIFVNLNFLKQRQIEDLHTHFCFIFNTTAHHMHHTGPWPTDTDSVNFLLHHTGGRSLKFRVVSNSTVSTHTPTKPLLTCCNQRTTTRLQDSTESTRGESAVTSRLLQSIKTSSLLQQQTKFSNHFSLHLLPQNGSSHPLTPAAGQRPTSRRPWVGVSTTVIIHPPHQHTRHA